MTVPVQITHVKGTVLLKPSNSLDQSLQVESLLEAKEDSSTVVIIVKILIQVQLKKGLELGQVTGVAIVNHTKKESLLSP